MLISKLSQLHTTVSALCRQPGKIALLTHTNPDGDGLPACLAMKEILRKMGHKADVVLEAKPPKDMLFLKTSDEILIYDETMEYSTAFMIDCHEPERTGKASALIEKATNVIAIDHHEKHDLNSKWYYYIDPATVSAGAIILKTYYEDIKKYKIDDKRYISDCLYTTILNDTDGFINNNTDSEVFRLCSQLCKLGTIPSQVMESFVLNNTPQKLKFIGQAMASSELYFEDRVMFILSTQENFQENDLTSEAASKVTKWVKGAHGIDVFIYARELEDGDFRLSLRSPVVNCNKICGKFGGGGHTSASGCHIKGNLADMKKAILNEVEKELHEESGISTD